MSEEWKHAGWVSALGKWAWILGIVGGIISIIYGIYTLSLVSGLLFFGLGIGIGPAVWNIISGIIAIIIAIAIIRPKFSNKCADKDWNFLMNWVWSDGFRFPWMLFWGILMHVFGFYFAGAFVTIPSLVLIFAGPEKFEWKK
ncbi:MAG: hypothetical protein ACW990_20550 [Promethearchaeota archaeon]|jgi:hypothetical protein